MAEVPQSTGRSPSGGVMDDSAGGANVPAWLAARRARGPMPVVEHEEPDVEFGSIAEEPDSNGFFVSIDAPKAKAASEEPFFNKISGPPPRKLKPSELPKALQAADKPRDHSLKALAAAALQSATMKGVVVSLIVHTSLLVVLGFLVIKGSTLHQGLDIFGIVGDSDGNALSNIELDSAMSLEEPGGGSPSLDFTDASQITGDDKMSFDPSASIRGLPGGKGKGTGTGDGEGDGEGVGVPALSVPKYAVTKGSFSAWTDPKDPEPGVSYQIVIQFRLPSNVRVYKGSDLSGMVIGTDGYKQVIRLPRTESLPVTDGAVQVQFRVPGADRLVRDTIRIESKLLREKQVIEIEF